MRAAVLPCLLLALVLLAACRPPPTATPVGARHLVIVASHPVSDAARAGLTPEHLDQIDDLLLPRLDWTEHLQTGDELHVLVDHDRVRAVRVDGEALHVAGALVDGRARDEHGHRVPAHSRRRPVATRALTSYPLLSFDMHDPVRVEHGDNGVVYGVASDTIVTATHPGEVHVLGCCGNSPFRTCELEVTADDGPELFVEGPLEPLVRTGDQVRAGQPIGHVPAHSRRQLRYGVVGATTPSVDTVDASPAVYELLAALDG
jgi:hypothetical protein